MSRADLWNKSVPRAELDRRAREARLRLAQIERLLVPSVAAADSYLGRVIRLFGLGVFAYRSRRNQTRRPLSHRRPSDMAEIPHAWFEGWGPASHA